MMAEMLYKATKYMIVEDAMITRGGGGTQQEKGKGRMTLAWTDEESQLERMSEGMTGDQNPHRGEG